MKFRTYLVIMQPPTVALLALTGLAASWVFHWFAPLASHRSEAMPFVVLTLLGPFLAGCIISHTLHVPLHRPFSITLPNLRRNFLQWHVPALALFALLLAQVAGQYDSTLPRPVAASIAFAALCLMLPLEAGLYWYGSSKLLAAVTGTVILAALWANETRTVLLYLPWLTVTGSLALAAFCCQLMFDRQRLRKRARVLLSSMAETPSAEMEQRQTMADTPRLGRSWTHGAVGNSTANWIRAIRHENIGYRARFAKSWMILPLLNLIVLPATAYFQLRLPKITDHQVPLGQFIYRCIWEHEPFGASSALLQKLVLIALFSSTVIAGTLLRPQRLHPISRAQRARLTFILFLLEVGILLFAVFTSIIALSWFSAWQAGWPFRPTTVPDFVVVFLSLAPLIPFLQWLKLRALFSAKKHPMDGTVYMIIYLLGGALFMFVTRSRNWLLSPEGLTVIAIALAASLYAYRAALFRFYRRGDLLQRQPSE